MNKTILIITFLVFLSCTREQSEHRIEIEVNTNIELLGLAYFIGYEVDGIETDTLHFSDTTLLKKEWHNYGYNLANQFSSYAASENLAVCFAVADHLWLDYLFTFLLQVEAFPNAKFPDDIDASHYIQFSLSGDLKEAREKATQFLDGMNAFYREISFNDYWTASRPYYDQAIREVRNEIPPVEFIEANEKFYKKSFNRYILIPSLTTPKGMGFGIRIKQNDSTSIYNVFGALDYQLFTDLNDLKMGFTNSDRLHELTIHEFGHSFVNPFVDELPDSLITASQSLFEPLRQVMSDQGYVTWKACLYEHFVRAGEIYLWTKLKYPDRVEKLKTEYIQKRQFIYIPVILTELQKYNQGEHASYIDAVYSSINKFKEI